MVSIVIPVYNGSNYMREAIDSALAQTYENCEVIVVNDGSMDNTEEIALSYGDKIRYLKKENGGVASALNLAIQEMRGEYFSWLSHDDIYYPHKVNRQMQKLCEYGDMKMPLYSAFDILWMEDNKKTFLPPEYRFGKVERENGLFPVLFGLVHGCTTLIHKSHFERVGVFDESLLTAQDYDMWFRIFRGQRVGYIDEELITARSHTKQGSKTIERYKRNCEEIQLDMISRLTEAEILDLFGSKYQMYYHMMKWAEQNELDGCIEEWLPQFAKQEQPNDKGYLDELKAEKEIILYCAGRNGRRLRKELELYGIEASAFSDGNQAFWNTEIDGLKCVPLQDVSKEAMIIVTKDYPEGVIEYLQESGHKKVVGYNELVKKLFESIPIKNKVENKYAREKKLC